MAEMIDKSKNYRTRDGREVRIYATDGGSVYPIHGSINAHNTYWRVTTWTQDGRMDKLRESDEDLIEVRPRHKRVVWVNVYANRVVPYDCRESADKWANEDRIACLRVELDFEEGEGL